MAKIITIIFASVWFAIFGAFVSGCGDSTQSRHSGRIEMQSVSSSAIDAVGYSQATGELTIRFPSGNEYSYPNVPQSVYDGLMSASSKGRYFNEHIRYKYSELRQ